MIRSMVRHIVLYFLKDNTQENKQKVKDKLLSMRGQIECLKEIEVGFDFLHSGRSCDLSLMCTFEDRAGLEEYANHPKHLPVKEYLRDFMEKSVSSDYEF